MLSEFYFENAERNKCRKLSKSSATFCHKTLFALSRKRIIMVNKNQNGFSLIELLIVCVVVGVIAGLAIPGLLKSKQLAENESAYNALRAMISTELAYNSSNGRYARLTEINALHQNGLGEITPPNTLVRGKYTFVMSPSNPTDAQLKNSYHITVTKTVVGGDETPYTLDVDETGRIIEPYNINHR